MMFKSVRRNLAPHVAHLFGHFRGRLRRLHDLVRAGVSRHGDITEKAKDVKVIVTEKFQIPESDAAALRQSTWRPKRRASRRATPLTRQRTLMTWTFVGTSTDRNKRTLDTILFFFTTGAEGTSDDDGRTGRGHRSARSTGSDSSKMWRRWRSGTPEVIFGPEKLQVDQQAGRRSAQGLLSSTTRTSTSRSRSSARSRRAATTRTP